jgi:hypothetical protein
MEKGAKPELRLVEDTGGHRRMTELARLFPTLRRADGLAPWDPHKLDAWACSGAPCHGGLHAARFMLAVWSGHAGRVRLGRQTAQGKRDGVTRFILETPWRCGPFDVVDAMGTWDNMHRMVFLAWAKEPWWP